MNKFYFQTVFFSSAVSFPAGGLEAQYRSNLKDVVSMLKTKHENSYIIFNLSRRRQDLSKLNHQVRDIEGAVVGLMGSKGLSCLAYLTLYCLRATIISSLVS